MRVLVCIKRVPDSSGQVVLTDDAQAVDGRFAGFTISDHENCAVECAVQISDDVTVLTVGGPETVEQLRTALGVGATAAVHIEAEPKDLGPADIAREIAAVVREHEAAGKGYDAILLGNDAADSGDFQVPIRLAHALAQPVVTGIKTVSAADGSITCVGDSPEGGTETYVLPTPAVVAITEGGVEPRYPSIKGRMAAKKVEIETKALSGDLVGASRVKLTLPPPVPSNVQVLGNGPEAAGAVVDLFAQLGVLAP